MISSEIWIPQQFLEIIHLKKIVHIAASELMLANDRAHSALDAMTHISTIYT